MRPLRTRDRSSPSSKDSIPGSVGQPVLPESFGQELGVSLSQVVRHCDRDGERVIGHIRQTAWAPD